MINFAAKWFVFISFWAMIILLCSSPIWVTTAAWISGGAALGLPILGVYTFVLVFFSAVWLAHE